MIFLIAKKIADLIITLTHFKGSTLSSQQENILKSEN